MYKFLAASAALALAATAAYAEPGKGKGGGNDRAPVAEAKGGSKDQHGHAGKTRKAPDRAGDDVAGMRDNRSSIHSGVKPGQNRRAESSAKAVKVDRKVERRVDNRGKDERSRDGVSAEGRNRTVIDRERDARVRDAGRLVRFDVDGNRGLIDGCPPGLAKKRNGCTPPGLLKSRDSDYRYRQAYYPSDWWGFSSLEDRVYYDDGYLYRLGDNNSILGYIPLLGGALSVGNVWPSMYQPVPVPNYYVDYYNLGPQGSYRYADNVLYRVDPESAAITSIAALLTGDNFSVGQPMPLGYDVYNVPYAYRDQYYDRPDALYRYSDGYVYQVDPETRLIAAAIELLI